MALENILVLGKKKKKSGHGTLVKANYKLQ